MADSPLSIAQDLFVYARCNPSRIAEVKAAFDAAVSAGPLTRGGLSDVTSATKNGVSYQKTVNLSESNRIYALRTAIAALDSDTYPSSRSYARFGTTLWP